MRTVPRRRPRERRPDDRPHELLEAALAVFSERGYRNARIDDVAEAAGVTKGAVYHHFANKEQLLSRAVEHHLGAVLDDVEEALREAGGTVAHRIRLLLRRAFGGTHRNSRRVLALLQQGLRHDAPAVHRLWLVGGPMRVWDLLADLIREGQADGEFRVEADAPAAARLVVSGVLTQLVWQAAANDIPSLAFDEGRLIDAAADLLLRGLEPLVHG